MLLNRGYMVWLGQLCVRGLCGGRIEGLSRRQRRWSRERESRWGERGMKRRRDTTLSSIVTCFFPLFTDVLQRPRHPRYSSVPIKICYVPKDAQPCISQYRSFRIFVSIII